MSLDLRAMVLATLLVTGCARASMQSPAGRQAVFDDRSTRVTAAELSRYAEGRSLMEALQRLRPGFLTVRGAQPLVSVDGAAAGDQSLLNVIPVAEVFEVRLVKATSLEGRASIRPNGDVITGDILLVLTRKR